MKTHPANKEPHDIEILLGSRCAPIKRWINKHSLSMFRLVFDYLPAVLALVKATVSNHMGKKYIIEKLQFATKKFCNPTRTGIF